MRSLTGMRGQGSAAGAAEDHLTCLELLGALRSVVELLGTYLQQCSNIKRASRSHAKTGL